MQEENKNNLISETTQGMLDKAAEELAWILIAQVEQKFNKNKYNKIYVNRTRECEIQNTNNGGREVESDGNN
jgi:hypothetical protein